MNPNISQLRVDTTCQYSLIWPHRKTLFATGIWNTCFIHANRKKIYVIKFIKKRFPVGLLCGCNECACICTHTRIQQRFIWFKSIIVARLAVVICFLAKSPILMFSDVNSPYLFFFHWLTSIWIELKRTKSRPCVMWKCKTQFSLPLLFVARVFFERDDPRTKQPTVQFWTAIPNGTAHRTQSIWLKAYTLIDCEWNILNINRFTFDM